jgi:hypothetical protein
MVEGDDIEIPTTALHVSLLSFRRVEGAYSLDVGVDLADTW